MKILVSACLLGENCKYNGGNNYSEKLVGYLEKLRLNQSGLSLEGQMVDGGNEIEVIPVCPEQLGGLPTPRIPAEIRNGVVTNREGVSVDREFRLGATKALEIALAHRVELAILQSRSPSCGPKQIYDGTFSQTLISGKGIFAEQLAKHGIRMLDVEDIK